MISSTIEQLETLFPRVDRQCGIVFVINNGLRPAVVNYSQKVSEADTMMVAFADHILSLVGRLISTQEMYLLLKRVKPDVIAWLRKISPESNKVPNFAIDIMDDGLGLWAGWSGSEELLNLRTGDSKRSVAVVPAEAHLYNLTTIYMRTKQRMAQLNAAISEAGNNARKQQNNTEQSGRVCDVPDCDPDGQVRTGSPVVVSGNDKA